MYQTTADPYCYAGTAVLKNKLNIRDPAVLAAFEQEITDERSAQLLPSGQLSVSHYRAIHRFLFQDVYRWGGKTRTVRLMKGGNPFAFPEHIDRSLNVLFERLKLEGYLRDLSPEGFATGAASFLAELNHIHAFREGNGRAQLSFMSVLAAQAGYPLVTRRLHPQRFLQAMIASYHGQEEPLAAQLRQLIG